RFRPGWCNWGGRGATSLCTPGGVATDLAGNLYVADRGNSRVLEYDTPRVSGVTADRVFGQGGSFTLGTCNTGGVSVTSLCSPGGVAVDADANVYDTEKRNSPCREYDTRLVGDVTADRTLGQGGTSAASDGSLAW